MSKDQNSLSRLHERLRAVRECRLSDLLEEYNKSRPKEQKLKVSGPMLKLVLLELGRWELDRTIYESQESIEHHTELSHSSLVRAMTALVTLGLIRRKPIPGPRMNKITEVCWNRVLALGSPFRPAKLGDAGQSGEETNTPALQPAPTPTPPKSSATAESSSVVPPSPDVDRIAGAFRSLKHVGPRLTLGDADWLAKRFLATLGPEYTLKMIAALEEKQLAKAANPDTRNPAGYMYRCLDNAIVAERSEGLLHILEDVRTGEASTINFPDDMRDALISFYLRILSEKAGDEFVFGDLQRDGAEGCSRYIAVRPRATAQSENMPAGLRSPEPEEDPILEEEFEYEEPEFDYEETEPEEEDHYYDETPEDREFRLWRARNR